MLTIAIPTYNRAARLQTQIECLLPQLRPGVRLHVFDNGSTDDTRSVVEKYADRGVSYTRAAYNGGAGRNFFRCMEECQTEWLWMLSDDDPAMPDAVARLLELLANSQCDYVHTSSPLWDYDAERVVTNVVDLFQYARFSSLLWLSCGIYRLSSFRPFFRLFNDSISTMGPQMIVVLALLESQGAKVQLSPLRLFQSPSHGVEWSTLDFIVRIAQAPEYLHQPRNQQLLAEGILYDWFDSAMLHGLRETGSPDQIRKWHRICRLSWRNLKAYNAKRHWLRLIRNCFKPGLRNEYLKAIAKALIVMALSRCPVCLFHPLLKVMPLSKPMRASYNRRDKYVPYA